MFVQFYRGLVRYLLEHSEENPSLEVRSHVEKRTASDVEPAQGGDPLNPGGALLDGTGQCLYTNESIGLRVTRIGRTPICGSIRPKLSDTLTVGRLAAGPAYRRLTCLSAASRGPGRPGRYSSVALQITPPT